MIRQLLLDGTIGVCIYLGFDRVEVIFPVLVDCCQWTHGGFENWICCDGVRVGLGKFWWFLPLSELRTKPAFETTNWFSFGGCSMSVHWFEVYQSFLICIGVFNHVACMSFFSGHLKIRHETQPKRYILYVLQAEADYNNVLMVAL